MQKFVPKGEVGNRLFTPVNVVMTAGRPLYMAMSMFHANRGNVKKSVKWAAIAGISDFESPVCAGVEIILPGWGYSELGAKGDQGMDSAALVVAGLGTIANRRVHPLARLGMGLIMIQEAVKIKQAAKITEEWQAVTGDKSIPKINSTDPGKRSMADKLLFVGMAEATISEKMPRWARAALGISSLFVAGQAIREAEVARGEYSTQFYDEILPAAVAAQQAAFDITPPVTELA